MRYLEPSAAEIDFTNDIRIILHDIFPAISKFRPDFEEICTYIAQNTVIKPRSSIYHMTQRAYVFDSCYNLIMLLYDLKDEEIEFIRYCVGQKFPPERNIQTLLLGKDAPFEELQKEADQDMGNNFTHYLAIMKGQKVTFNMVISSEVVVNIAYRLKKKDRLRRLWMEDFHPSTEAENY